jgi:predicted aldo/keto reductase-like oxidoreductase
VRKLKADGRVKHAGISSHGPRDKGGDSMERVLLAAAEDGRFDVMLLVYNFLNSAAGERVLAACKKQKVGTTLMKTAPGRLKIEPFDPRDPSEEHARVIRLLIGRGHTREQAVAKIQEKLAYQRRQLAKNQPALDAFVKRHGIETQDDLAKKSVQWVLSNEGVNTVCVSMPDFERIDDFVALSGTRLARDGQALLDDYTAAFGEQYCRHGCSSCLDRCPYGVPVGTVMRYAYYFQCQGREKHAMKKYAGLGGVDGSRCLDCEGPCRHACPHGVAIQAQLIAADNLLSLA